MDFSSSRQWIDALWILFCAYWLISAFKRKKTKQRESWFQRFGYVLLPLVAFYFLLQPRAHFGLLGERFIPAGPLGEWIGVFLTAAGIGIAFWARWHLGTNWSGPSP